MILKKLFVLSFIIAILTSCSTGDPNQIPEGILSKEQMTEAFINLHILEAVMANKGFKVDTTRAEYRLYEKEVLLRHKIDPEAFRNSKTFYFNHPRLLNEVYEAVVDSLGVRERKKQIK